MSVSGVPILTHPIEFTFGCDLAKKRDWTALALLKRIPSGGEPGHRRVPPGQPGPLARAGLPGHRRAGRRAGVPPRACGRSSSARRRTTAPARSRSAARGTRSRSSAVDAGGVGAAVVDLLLTPRVLEVADVVPDHDHVRRAVERGDLGGHRAEGVQCIET